MAFVKIKDQKQKARERENLASISEKLIKKATQIGHYESLRKAHDDCQTEIQQIETKIKMTNDKVNGLLLKAGKDSHSQVHLNETKGHILKMREMISKLEADKEELAKSMDHVSQSLDGVYS